MNHFQFSSVDEGVGYSEKHHENPFSLYPKTTGTFDPPFRLHTRFSRVFPLEPLLCIPACEGLEKRRASRLDSGRLGSLSCHTKRSRYTGGRGEGVRGWGSCKYRLSYSFEGAENRYAVPFARALREIPTCFLPSPSLSLFFSLAPRGWYAPGGFSLASPEREDEGVRA